LDKFAHTLDCNSPSKICQKLAAETTRDCTQEVAGVQAKKRRQLHYGNFSKLHDQGNYWRNIPIDTCSCHFQESPTSSGKKHDRWLPTAADFVAADISRQCQAEDYRTLPPVCQMPRLTVVVENPAPEAWRTPL